MRLTRDFLETDLTYLETVEKFTVEAAFTSVASDILNAALLAAYLAAGGNADDPVYKVSPLSLQPCGLNVI